MKVAETVSTSQWSSPPNELVLSEDDVHVWRASLDLKPAHVQALLKTLSTDEISKAERFFFEKDQRYFIAARGLLRTILGKYLKTDPSCLRFCYNPYGKPALVEEHGGNTYSFNLSHSHGLLLLAITRSREIGVDLDRLRAGAAGHEIAKRFFSPREFAELDSLPKDQVEAAFFKCWTQKEAYVKAKGEGLAAPLDQFDVSLAPGEPAALRYTASSEGASAWSLEELHPGPGYVAALAVRGRSLRLKCWQWLEEY